MGTYTLPDGSDHDDLLQVFSDIGSDTDALIVIHFEAGTHVWAPSSTMTLNIPATCMDFAMYGDGENDTFFQDNWSYTGDWIFRITGINNKFRFHHFQMTHGPNYTLRTEWCNFDGISNDFRIHHWKINDQNFAPPRKIFRLTGWLRGVIDHYYLKIYSYCQVAHVDHGYPDSYGDTRWASATPKGSGDAIYFEDGRHEGYVPVNTIINDSDHGGSTVVRFVHAKEYTLFQTHPTVSLRSRGSRHGECYCNTFENYYENPPGQASPPFTSAFVSSGTFYMFKNTKVGGNSTQVMMHLLADRRNTTGYGNTTTPHSWGFSGYSTGHFFYATVSVSGTTVTRESGNLFQGGTPPYTYAILAGAKVNIDGTIYDVTSVTDASHLEIGTSITKTSVAFYPIGHWDANNDVYGHLNMDQPSAGQGDMLTGTFDVGAGVINTDRGNVGWTDANCHPHQAIEPIYYFQNDWSYTGYACGQAICFGTGQSDVLVQNRNYFTDLSGKIGTGTEAEMLASSPSTVGQGWWVTDLGDWNVGGSNAYTYVTYTGQGQLWVWDGADWVLDYEPYEYPHPLVRADEGEPPPPPGRKTRPGKVSRSF